MARAAALMLLLVLAAAAAPPTLGMRMGSAQKDFNKLVKFLQTKKNGYTSLLGALVSQGEPSFRWSFSECPLPCTHICVSRDPDPAPALGLLVLRRPLR